jgi:hypothetical protein
MKARVLHARKLPKQLIVIVLISWLGGLGCLFGCDLGLLAYGNKFLDKNSCHFKGKTSSYLPECHRKAKKAEVNSETITKKDSLPNPTKLTCCPMYGMDATIASNLQVTHDKSLTNTLSFQEFELPSIHKTNLKHFEKLKDRGGTYLRNHVLLI